MTLDVNDFYYGIPMKDFEHGHIPLGLIPDEIIKQNNLPNIAVNGKAYFEIRKGMPGLKQVGIITCQRLAKYLELYECKSCSHSPSICKYATLPINFTLVVDDLGVKHTGTKSAHFLIDTFRKQHEMSTDWIGKNYIGVCITWSYNSNPRHATIDMPKHAHDGIMQLKHLLPSKLEHSPAQHAMPAHGSKFQHAKHYDESLVLPPEDIKCIQRAVGLIICYDFPSHSTNLVLLSYIATEKYKVTTHEMSKLIKLLNCMSTHPDARF